MSHLENDINSLVSCFSGWGCKTINFSVARTQTQACKPASWSHTNGLQWLQCSCPAFSPTPLRADFSPVSPLHYKVLSGWQCFGKDKGLGTTWHVALCNMGSGIQVLPTCMEHPGGEAALWVTLCLTQPLTCIQPAPGGRTVLGITLRPPGNSVDNGSPPVRGRERAARIRGQRALLLSDPMARCSWLEMAAGWLPKAFMGEGISFGK